MKQYALLIAALLSAPAAVAADKLPKDCKPYELWVHSYGKTQYGKPIWVSSLPIFSGRREKKILAKSF